jgi:F0F1-type ATP synthase assembly protein I
MNSHLYRWIRGPGVWISLTVVLLLIGLVLPIYSISMSVSAGSISQERSWQFLVGSTFRNTTSCAGPIRCQNSTMVQPYTSGQLPHVGSLMQLMAWIWILAASALVVAVAIDASTSHQSHRRRNAVAYLLGGASLGLIVSQILLGVFLTRDVNADRVAFPNSGSEPGPWSSFVGGASSNGYGLRWGPALGWYFSLAALTLLVLILVGFWFGVFPVAPAASTPGSPEPPAAESTSGVDAENHST